MKNFCFYFIVVFFLSNQLAFGQSNENCPESMLSYWKLDEFGASNVFLDSYGDNHATLANQTRPAEDSGLVNQARRFTDSSGIYVTNTDDFNWTRNSEFTIELWIKTTQPGTGNKVFISRPPTENNRASWWLGYGEDNRIIFSVRDTNEVQSTLNGSKFINDGEWHHIVAIKNDSIKVLQLYIDGETDNKISTFFTGNFSNVGPLYIGAYGDGFYFNGLLDEIAIFNERLSENQIKQHYSSALQGMSYCQIPTGIEDIENTPFDFSLEQNYPNPFNPSTNISFYIPKQTDVKLMVYNVLGEHIATLADGVRSTGNHKIEFNAGSLPSGLYFYRLETDGFSETKKMILIR